MSSEESNLSTMDTNVTSSEQLYQKQKHFFRYGIGFNNLPT
jgi:hypothetical protein